MSMKMKFPKQKGNLFAETLEQRVQEYFTSRQLLKTGNWKLYYKGLLALIGIVVAYSLLLSQTFGLWGNLITLFFMVQSMIVLAFNTMHDGGHNSFAQSKKWNNIAACSMELLGSSSMLWRQKHNVLHHTYTNINGKDDDLDIGSLLRLSPDQQRRWWHSFQAFYAPVLYSLLSLYLVFWSDFQRMISGKIGDMPLQKRDAKNISFFIGGKIVYVLYTLVIPSFFYDFAYVALFFLIGHLILGFTLSVVFQLAHTVEGTEFPTSNAEGSLPYGFLEHQLRTTSDFAPKNWFATFYCGGLNFQVEHHLFHTISHIHYPDLSKIVKATCAEFNVPYHCQPSMFKALVSHFKFLHHVGNH